MPRRPIFLHSGFRAGSTWFWNRFRECGGAYGYCEPFNLQHAYLTLDRIRTNRHDVWASGHPGMRPYYEEYAPFLGENEGVALYEPRFAVETYFKTEADPAIERYVTMLADYAPQLGKTAVLGFCCSLGRVAWFRRFMDGINIVSWRNPRDQWLSSHQQWLEQGNYHFEVHYLLVAYIGLLDPNIAHFFDQLPPVPSPADMSPAMPLFADASGVADRFRIFLRVFMLDTLMSVQHADTVVDLDLLSKSASYRADMTDRLRRESGLPDLSFDDCNLPRHAFGVDADYSALLREGMAFLNALAASPDAAAFDKSLPFLYAHLSNLIGGGE